jgi:uncharacterized repeat protein (TIGR01451 family)
LVLALGLSSQAPVKAQAGDITQLAMVLDGSGSITDDDWDTIVNGLADAVANSQCVPKDSSVELTVIQFAGSSAVVEIAPTLIDSGSTANSLASDIRNLVQDEGFTPIACGLRQAADTLAGSPNFDPANKQAVNLVTDGQPNRCCDGTDDGSTCTDAAAEDSAEAARQYLITELSLDETQDEIDAEFIGAQGDASDWLRDEIVWPEPGYYGPPFDQGPGWVRVVEDADEFAATICEKFGALLAELTIDKDVVNEPAVVVSGQSVTYAIRVANRGADTAEDVVITDTLPGDGTSSFQFVSTVATSTLGGASCNLTDVPQPGDVDLQWSSCTLPTDGSVALTYTVDVGEVVSGTYDNTAYANGSNVGQVDDDGTVGQDDDTPAGEDPEDDEDVTVLVPCTRIDKDVLTPQPVEPGDEVLYQIRVVNTFTTTTPFVTISDTLPTDFTYVRTDEILTSGGVTNTGEYVPTVGESTPRWGRFEMSGNSEVIIRFTARVAATVPDGTYDNDAFASCSLVELNIADLGDEPGDPGQTIPGEDQEPDEDVIVESRPHMLIDKDVITLQPVEPGSEVIYQIRVFNVGTASALGVIVSDTLPAGFSYASTGSIETSMATRSSPSNPSPGDAVPMWGIWEIGVGGALTIPFTVDVAETVALGTYDNTAYADGDNFDQIDDDGNVGLEEPERDTPPGEDPETDEDVRVSIGVGGVTRPVGTLQLLAPWMSIAALVGALAAAGILWRILATKRT